MAAAAASASPRSNWRTNSARRCTRPPARMTNARLAYGSVATRRSTTRPRISPPAIKELTGGRGVDVILDMVGGAYAMRNIRSLAMDGRWVLIAFLGGSKVENFDSDADHGAAADGHGIHDAAADDGAEGPDRG